MAMLRSKIFAKQEEPRTFRGLPLVIENPKGSIRTGTNPQGESWERPMYADYGYIEDTSGKGDKEPVDVYVGEDETAANVYIVEQKGDGEPDEFKLMLGFPTLESAVEMYLKHYPAGWEDNILGVYEAPFTELFEAVGDHQEKTASHGPIPDFLKQYNQAWYSKVADEVRDALIQELALQNIRAIVSSRGKSFTSVQTKLFKRNEEKQYQSVLDIHQDIKDLAGVRVALYFPNDSEKAGEVIAGLFPQARPVKFFPQDRLPHEPEGYTATHYCVWWKSALVEIQVASALMFAWSEVAHDLLYKPRRGVLSLTEQQILDDLLAIVNAGEVKVMELQRSVDHRTLGQLEFELMASWQQKSASIRPCTEQYLPKFARALEQILAAEYVWPSMQIDHQAFARAAAEVLRGRTSESGRPLRVDELSEEEQREVRRLAQLYKDELKAEAPNVLK